MQLPGLNIGIVADDLTGATDCALQFFLAGLPTQVLLNLEHWEEAVPANTTIANQRENQVWSINTDSRHLDKAAAEAAVKRAVTILRDQFGVENFYKKIDSTLRGHFAHECLGMLDMLDADCAVIAPAFPQEGRRTVGGYQLVRGMPIERTQVIRDPLFPVRQSHIPTLLSQTTTPDIVGYISLSTVLHGAGPILVELSQQIQDGKKLVVVDATSNEDLEQIALAIEKVRNKAQNDYKVIPCGSSGLAQALTNLWAENQASLKRPVLVKPKEPLSFSPSPILIVSGSNTETTRNQMLQLIENYGYYGQDSHLEVFDLSPEQILGLAPVTDTIQQIITGLGDNNTVILSTSLKDENYTRTLELGRENNLSDRQVVRKAQDVLATITQQVVAAKNVKLVLTGGETASRVCRALGSQCVKLVDEAQPAIPVTVDDKGHWIITKSGNFGEPLVIANLVQFIKDHEATSLQHA